METVIITLHGEQLGSVVPAPEDSLPHADLQRHVTIRANDYFGARHIFQIYFREPLPGDQEQVLGYYIVESDSSGDEDLVFKLEDLTLKRTSPPEESATPFFETTAEAIKHHFHRKIASTAIFICSKCSNVQRGGGLVSDENYQTQLVRFTLEAACNSCCHRNVIIEEKGYQELFMGLQTAIEEAASREKLP